MEQNFEVPIDTFKKFWNELNREKRFTRSGPSVPTLGFRGTEAKTGITVGRIQTDSLTSLMLRATRGAPSIDQAIRYLRTFQNTERSVVIIQQVQIFVLPTVLYILYQAVSPRIRLTDSLLVVVVKWFHCRRVKREAMKIATILLLLFVFAGCGDNDSKDKINSKNIR